MQLLPTIVPQSAKFNYTKVSEGHKHEGAGSIAQVWFPLLANVLTLVVVALSRKRL